MLWRFDPPYPSITLVMTKYQAETFDISQLPAPGRSVLERCQLRAKKNTPRQGQDRLLVRMTRLMALISSNRRGLVQMTVDYRYTVQPTVGVTTIPSSVSREPFFKPFSRSPLMQGS